MRKRSKYRPKKNLVDPVTWVIAGIKPFNDIPVAVDLRVKNHDAMNKLRLGTAGKADIDIIIGAFNMTEGFMRLRPDLGRDWAKEIRTGQDALLTMAKRGVEMGRFILRAEELVAMNLVMEIHDEQLNHVNVRDMEKAMAIIDSDHRHKKSRPVSTTLKEPA